MKSLTANRNMINISIIYGKAGTGKSTTLAKMIFKCIESCNTYVVLTATHASLNNIYNIVNRFYTERVRTPTTFESPTSISSDSTDPASFITDKPPTPPTIPLSTTPIDSADVTLSASSPLDRSHFKTIYSFFHIDYENEVVVGCSYVPHYIFIDEFSLINKNLFKRIIRSLYSRITSSIQLILTGDAMQLNAIYKDKQYISLSKLNRLTSVSSMKALYPAVVDHLHLSIFGLKRVLHHAKKKQLTTNHRNSQMISNLLTSIYNRIETYSFPFVDDINELVALINNGYIFISSMYKHIQHIYDTLGKSWIDNGLRVRTIEQPITFRAGLKRLYLYQGIQLMLTVTSTRKDSNGNPLYFNGEYVTWNGTYQSNGDLICTNSNGSFVYVAQETDTSIPVKPKYYPVIPKALITIHKSQGQTIDNVIVCIDDLFDMCMLYTAITRGRTDVRFFTFKGSKNRVSRLFESAYINEFKQLNTIVAELNGKNEISDESVDDQ